MAWQLFAGAAAGSLVSGIFGRGESRKREREEERYLDDLLNMENQAWDMRRSLSIATRDEDIRKIKLDQRNERKFAVFKDANNMQAHNYATAIYNYENEQWNRQYQKSEELYKDALSLNARSAQLAREDEVRALQEERQKYAFKNEDSIIENLIETGTLVASGITGRSGMKAAQAQMAALGRNQAVMTASMVSATRNTQANIRNINHELMEANTVAKSRRMLKPEYGPAPVKPLATPISDYEFPRELQDFDFGPKPIRGQKTTFTPSWGSVFANAASSGLSAWNFGYKA